MLELNFEIIEFFKTIKLSLKCLNYNFEILRSSTYFLDHFVGDIEMTVIERKCASPFYTTKSG